MEKESEYVKCSGCEWQLAHYPERNWKEYPCTRCANTRQVLNPIGILCNLCGECMCPIGTVNEQIPHGLHNAVVSAGYDSYHLLDGHSYQFSICEACLRRMFIVAKIKPKIDPYIGSHATSWEDDQEYYEYRIWVDAGHHHTAYLNKKCNKIKDCPNEALYTIRLSDEFTEECVCESHKDLWNNTVNATLVKFISNKLKPFL